MTKAYRSTDKRLNPWLADKIATVRGGMTEAAERVALPHRFVVTEHPDRPAMWITDTATGRKTVVSLCDYRGVREALAELFP